MLMMLPEPWGIMTRKAAWQPHSTPFMLMAIAIACTTQCAYCLDVHTRNAKKAGATREEVAEAVFIAAALRAGAAATHGTLALKLFDGHTAAPSGTPV